MGKKDIKVGGIALIIYSLLLLLDGGLYLVLSMATVNFTIEQEAFLIGARMIFPLIMIIYGIIAFITIRNKKLMIGYVGIYLIYYSISCITAVYNWCFFFSMMDNGREVDILTVTYSCLGVISHFLVMIALILLIITMVKTTSRHKICKTYVVSTVLVSIIAVITGAKYIVFYFLEYTLHFSEREMIEIALAVILVLAVYYIGKDFNNEIDCIQKSCDDKGENV